MALSSEERKQLEALEEQVRNKVPLDFGPKKLLKELRAKTRSEKTKKLLNKYGGRIKNDKPKPNKGMGGMGGESQLESAESKLARKEANKQLKIETDIDKQNAAAEKLLDAELKDTAGIDKALNEINEDVRAQALDDDAQEFLQKRYKAMTDVGLPGAPEAGSVGKGQFSLSAHLDGLGEINSNTPEAYHWQLGNGAKLRIGTEYGEFDAETGQRSIVPSADPTDPKKALTMFEGTQNQAQAIGPLTKDANGMIGSPKNATEYIQRQLMRRTGRKVEMNNVAEKTAPDFVEELSDGKTRIVDGQIWQSGNRGFGSDNKLSEIYNWVETGEGDTGTPAAREIQKRINKGIDANPNASLGRVIKSRGMQSTTEGKLRGPDNNEPPWAGKIYDEGHHPKDKIFYADYEDEEAARLMKNNKSRDSKNKYLDTEMLAPNEIREEDVSKARALLESKRGDDLKSTVKVIPQGKNETRTKIYANWSNKDRNKITTTDAQIKVEHPEVRQFMREVDNNGVEITPDSGIGPTADSPNISSTPAGTPQAPRKSAAGLGGLAEDFTPKPGPVRRTGGGGSGGGSWLDVPFVRQAQEVVGNVMQNKAVRFAGKGLLALPVIGALGDAGDAYAGTKDVVDTSKSGLERRRGGVKGAAGITGLATLVAPAAPLLAPVAGGMAAGHMLGEITDHRRATDTKYTANSGKAEQAGRFSHTEDNPVTMGIPGTVQSETQRRRQARRSSTGATPVDRPQTGNQWWNQALGVLGLN